MLIERLTGILARTLPNGAVVEVGGIGYGVELPLSQICNLPANGSTVSFWTHTHVREDAIRLFGFDRYEERLAFEILLGLSGVGPKVALALLSTLTLQELRSAITRNDPAPLERVPGVGPRLAEKILVELKPKLKRLGSIDAVARAGASLGGTLSLQEEGEDDTLFEDLKSALENLGFRDKTIAPVVERLRTDRSLTTFPALMRKALVELGGTRAEGG